MQKNIIKKKSISFFRLNVLFKFIKVIQKKTNMRLYIIIAFLSFFYSTNLIVDFGNINGKNKDWILISDDIMGVFQNLSWSI